MADQLSLQDLLGKETTKELLHGPSFEQGVKLLEELVSKVESGSLALDKAILAYERGALLVEHLRGLLSGAEEKLKVLQRPSEKI